MSTAPRYELFTFEDFCIHVKDGMKGDLIDGVIYMASPDNTDAAELFVWLIRLMADFVEYHELGKVYGSRVAFKLDESNSPEPDIGFIRTDRLSAVLRGHVEGPPDLAVEIVSPESVDRDYKKKRDQYERFGVTEYWIIDEMKQKVTLLRLDGRGKYREVRPRQGKLHSQVLPGFWIRPEWMWPQTRPKKVEALAELLAESSGTGEVKDE